ncbi:MAG TPA: ECF transporter S component [Candidatus Binatia bacterium]|nr:ECF transporter S component [Candidatus Binatia bacterium]
MLIAVSAVGAVLFLWPFVLSGLPTPAIAVSLALGCLAVMAVVEVLTRRLDSRRFALLAAIVAIEAALRLVLVTGIGGFSPVFFLILVAGYACGPSFGFLCGATSLLASAVATGGIGPWLPYEMFGCGWIGAIAGLAGTRRRGAPGRRDVVLLVAISIVTGFVYGALLDVWDWTTFYRGNPSFGFLAGAGPAVLLPRFAHFYLATSATWDSFRAVGDAILVLVLGAPIMGALARLRDRMAFRVDGPELARLRAATSRPAADGFDPGAAPTGGLHDRTLPPRPGSPEPIA